MGAQPIRRRNAPAIARHKARETVGRHRRTQIVTDRPLMLKKLSGHDRADRVAALIFRPRVAAPVAVKARNRVAATRLQFAADDVALSHASEFIAGRRPAPIVAAPAGQMAASSLLNSHVAQQRQRQPQPGQRQHTKDQRTNHHSLVERRGDRLRRLRRKAA